jgi:putative peptide zinc metalloprotease protein
MEDTAPASELERRKSLRIRLRRDLAIDAQKYEGRTYYVIKDPISLRYYRLKENEHFLLKFLDGQHTLEDAQKAYEAQFRPDRLKLEDVEGFAQQLLTGGLAQNDSPRAGKQLYDRRRKKKRSEWIQTFTNILYIKIPVIDPDRILDKMLRSVGWIFSMWFFILSIGLMLSAIGLVGVNFAKFLDKLPDYHEFFTFGTVVNLWAALAVVKVIHEFGHGLSCKRFGGEVHEMGALLLCLSPALYCNVSDAWTLPSKWHRIIISSAGIYVELVIASISVWVWWYTPSQPYINNMALALVVVCSVSTVVFNANPLMRYDGYYVLADWLEIPNLRERSNRFLGNIVLEHCLGVEVQPESYMALWRRVLFVFYAIASYIYKWVVTFGIIWFFSEFLKPYKLEVVGQMVAVASLASMLGWPIYRLGKNIYKRGRLPDMKRWRVVTTGLVLTAFVLFLICVPLPLNKVRGKGLVEPQPESSVKMFVRYPGVLEKLNVRTGQHVEQGEELAVFRNIDVEGRRGAAAADEKTHQEEARADETYRDSLQAGPTRDAAQTEMNRVAGLRDTAAVDKKNQEKILREDLVLIAPRSGVVGQAPTIDDVGKLYEINPDQPFCTIDEPRRLRVCLPLTTTEFNRLKDNLEDNSPASNRTRFLLQRGVTVNYNRTRLADVFADLRKQMPELQFKGDAAAVADDELLVTYRAERQSLSNVLEMMLEQYGLGYVVVSDRGKPEDGWLLVRAGQEHGYAEGPRQLADLGATLCIEGRAFHDFKGKVLPLPESEARTIPFPLTSKAGGPVAVKATVNNKTGALEAQTQQFLVYIDIVNADDAVKTGNLAEVKINCRPETCLQWAWRWVNATFDLRLM